MQRKMLTACIFAGLMSAGLSTQVLAQDGEADMSENILEEVIVTATKFSTNLMDTPLAVSAFEQEQLDKLEASNQCERVGQHRSEHEHHD